jgi:hypothetical protein
MELRQDIRRAAREPMAWGAAILIPLAIGLMSWNALTAATRSEATSASPAMTAHSLLDRNAERQPAPLLDRNAERPETS